MELEIEFASRKAGSFGASAIGRLMEWVTKTWLRFTCAFFYAFIVVAILPSNMRLSEKLLIILFAPLAAIFYWYAFLLLLLVCRYLGLFGRILAHVLVIYLFLFSRLIIQPPPKVWLPLISRGK